VTFTTWFKTKSGGDAGKVIAGLVESTRNGRPVADLLVTNKLCPQHAWSNMVLSVFTIVAYGIIHHM